MPCDRRRYPREWKDIRAAILERECHQCKFCGVPNHHYRVGEEIVNPNSDLLEQAWLDYYQDGQCKPRLIVLTVAHLDNPDPMDCRPENLAALCQRCHNRLDMPMRQSNARKTRASKVGQGCLLDA